MGASTAAVVDKLLKNKYRDMFYTAFREDAVGWQLASPQPRSFSGRVEIFPVKYGRGNGVGVRGEVPTALGGVSPGLPLPGGPKVENGQVDIRRIFGTLQWTKEAMSRTKDDPGAFKRLINFEIEDKYSRMLRELNVMFWGDGRGRRCVVAATASAISGSGGTGDVTVDTTRYLAEGDYITFWATDDSNVVANGGGDAGSAEKFWVKTIKDETTVTLQNDGSNAYTPTINQIVRNYGESVYNGSARVDYALVGLSAAIDDGTVASTYAGISRTAVPQWAANVKDAAGATLDEEIIIKMCDKAYRRAGAQAKQINTITMDLSLRRDYVRITKPDRRYAPIKELDAGYAEEALVLTAGNRKLRIVEDADHPYGKIFGFNKSDLEYYELEPLQLDDSTGSILKMGTPFGTGGTGDVFFAIIRGYGNFAFLRPFGAFQIKGLDYQLE